LGCGWRGVDVWTWDEREEWLSGELLGFGQWVSQSSREVTMTSAFAAEDKEPEEVVREAATV